MVACCAGRPEPLELEGVLVESVGRKDSASTTAATDIPLRRRKQHVRKPKHILFFVI
jgi:hypothetical protein